MGWFTDRLRKVVVPHDVQKMTMYISDSQQIKVEITEENNIADMILIEGRGGSGFGLPG